MSLSGLILTRALDGPVTQNKGLAHTAMLRAEAHNTANASVSLIPVLRELSRFSFGTSYTLKYVLVRKDDMQMYTFILFSSNRTQQ